MVVRASWPDANRVGRPGGARSQLSPESFARLALRTALGAYALVGRRIRRMRRDYETTSRGVCLRSPLRAPRAAVESQ